MKSLILSITMIMAYFNLQSQPDTVFFRYDAAKYEDTLRYQTDTIIFSSPLDRNVLIGTDVMKGTDGHRETSYFGLNLDRVEVSNCENEGDVPDNAVNKIASITWTDSTLTVSLQIVENCCHAFLCDVEILDEHTVNLIYHSYGTLCGCECCFGLTYHFNIEDYGGQLKGLKTIMINGNEKTQQVLR